MIFSSKKGSGKPTHSELTTRHVAPTPGILIFAYLINKDVKKSENFWNEMFYYFSQQFQSRAGPAQPELGRSKTCHSSKESKLRKLGVHRFRSFGTWKAAQYLR